MTAIAACYTELHRLYDLFGFVTPGLRLRSGWKLHTMWIHILMTSSCHLKTNICTVHINNDNLYGAATRPLAYKRPQEFVQRGKYFFMGGRKIRNWWCGN